MTSKITSRDSPQITFTKLRELRDWLNGLDDDALDAATNEADWFSAYVFKSVNGIHYYHIQEYEAR